MRSMWSFTIAKVGGTVVRIHLTFLLLLIWIGVVSWTGAGARSAWIDVTFIVLLFGCVLLHELGHVTAARAFGIPTRDITLYPIGGLARIQSRFESPRQELVIASAGPAVSLLLAGLLTVVAGPPPAALTLDANTGWREMAGVLAAANLALAVFNLLPVFPLDGGRIARALLSWWFGRRAGTHVAVWTGRIAGVLFAFYGLTHSQIMLAVIGIFVVFAASAESVAADLEDVLAGKTARDVMASRLVTLAATATLADAELAVIRAEQHVFPVVEEMGRPVGVVSRNEIIAAAQTRSGDTALRDVVDGTAPVVTSDAPARRVLALLEDGATAALVTDAAGRFAGLVTLENLSEVRLLDRRHRAATRPQWLRAQGADR
ncbi:MAG: site-2 protease family protein [Sphingomonas sp.]